MHIETLSIFSKTKQNTVQKRKKFKIKNRNGSQIWSLKQNTFNIFQNTENNFTYWESTMRMKQFIKKNKKEKKRKKKKEKLKLEWEWV